MCYSKHNNAPTTEKERKEVSKLGLARRNFRLWGFLEMGFGEMEAEVCRCWSLMGMTRCVWKKTKQFYFGRDNVTRGRSSNRSEV